MYTTLVVQILVCFEFALVVVYVQLLLVFILLQKNYLGISISSISRILLVFYRESCNLIG